MHIHVNFDLSGNVLAGAGLGAFITAGFIGIFTLLRVVAGSLMSLGGSSGVFTGEYFKWVAIYLFAGALVGGLIAATGLPWWAAGLIVLALLFGVSRVMTYIDRRRHKRRGY